MQKHDTFLTLDGAAIGLSTLCLLHCLALPALIYALPLLAVAAELHWLHQAFVVMATPVSILAIFRTAPQQGRIIVSGLIFTGLCLLVAGAFVPVLHDFEIRLTVSGALILSGAHLIRWRWHSAEAARAGKYD